MKTQPNRHTRRQHDALRRLYLRRPDLPVPSTFPDDLRDAILLGRLDLALGNTTPAALTLQRSNLGRKRRFRLLARVARSETRAG